MSIRTRLKTRLTTEHLEDRSTPATFTVTNLLDSGAGSLLDAIAQANDEVNHPGSDFIQFDPTLAGGIINLSTVGDTSIGPSALFATSEIDIRGSGQTIARSGAVAFRLFALSPNATLTLVTLTLNNGLAQGGRAVEAAVGRRVSVGRSTTRGRSVSSTAR